MFPEIFQFGKAILHLPAIGIDALLFFSLQVGSLSLAWLCVQTCGDAGDILGDFWMGVEEYAQYKLTRALQVGILSPA